MKIWAKYKRQHYIRKIKKDTQIRGDTTITKNKSINTFRI